MNTGKADKDNIDIAGDGSGIPKNKGVVPDPKSKAPVLRGKLKSTVKIAVILLFGVCTAVLAAYALMREKPHEKEEPVKKEEVTVVREKGSVDFEPFIAPFEKGRSYTYMKVDLSLGVSDEKLLYEIREKRNLLRKTIYDVLIDMIKRSESIPAPGDLKKEIGLKINAVLINGRIDRIFITEFVAV